MKPRITLARGNSLNKKPATLQTLQLQSERQVLEQKLEKLRQVVSQEVKQRPTSSTSESRWKSSQLMEQKVEQPEQQQQRPPSGKRVTNSAIQKKDKTQKSVSFAPSLLDQLEEIGKYIQNNSEILESIREFERAESRQEQTRPSSTRSTYQITSIQVDDFEDVECDNSRNVVKKPRQRPQTEQILSRSQIQSRLINQSYSCWGCYKILIYPPEIRQEKPFCSIKCADEYDTSILNSKSAIQLQFSQLLKTEPSVKNDQSILRNESIVSQQNKSAVLNNEEDYDLEQSLELQYDEIPDLNFTDINLNE